MGDSRRLVGLSWRTPVTPAAPHLPARPSARPWLDRLVRVLPLLGVACAVLFFHRRAAAPGAAFSSEDLREYFIPVRVLLQHIVHAGDWPFWQRSIYTGFPLWSSSEASLLLPTTWLFFGFNAARGLTLASLLH